MLSDCLRRLLPAMLLIGILAPLAHAGKTVDTIRQRGSIQCGVSTGVAGFSVPDSQGHWSGIDVDICRAIAAALLGSPDKVAFIPLSSQQRFSALQSGEVDLLARNTSWTLTRDTSLGLSFTGVTYYDGQGFLVPSKLKVTSTKGLKNAQVCVQSGTTNEKNLADYFRKLGIKVTPVVFQGFEASFKAFFAGRCQVYTTDISALAGIRNKEAANPNDYMILPEVISKEPLGPVVRKGDDEWFSIVRWVPFALINAEEEGVTQANVGTLHTTSKDPSIQRLLGTGEDSGKPLGLDRDWAYRAIKAVGNYGEIYARNVGPQSVLKLPRGLNRLWNKGGIMYAPPIR